MEPDYHPSASARSTVPMTKRVLRLAVTLGIVIVITVFYFAAHSLILTEPQESTFCPLLSSPAISTESACVKGGGTWSTATADKGSLYVTPASCNPIGPCEAKYTGAEKTYALYSFVAEVIFGVVLIGISMLPLGSSVVVWGLAYGGVLSLIIASVAYWSDAASWIKLGISGLALALLIYLGLKIFKD